jgi:hypothetical protein
VYAGDWIDINKLGQKFKSVNICPLIPLFLEDMPGVVARDLKILAMWLHKVYNTGIKGLSKTWCGLVSHVQRNTGGYTVLQYDDIVKISLPVSVSSGQSANQSLETIA